MTHILLEIQHQAHLTYTVDAHWVLVQQAKQAVRPSSLERIKQKLRPALGAGFCSSWHSCLEKLSNIVQLLLHQKH